MSKLLGIKLRHKVKLGHVRIKEAVHGLQVLGRVASPEAAHLGLIGEAVELERARHGHVATERAEAHLDELLRVQRTVVVATGAHRLRNEDTGRVEGLPDARQVDATGDLLYEHRGETLRTELLVDAQEVDLYGRDGSGKYIKGCKFLFLINRQLNLLIIDANLCRYGGDKAQQLTGFGCTGLGSHPNAAVPALVVVGRLEDPLKKVATVVEAEHVVVILNVVLKE